MLDILHLLTDKIYLYSIILKFENNILDIFHLLTEKITYLCLIEVSLVKLYFLRMQFVIASYYVNALTGAFISSSHIINKISQIIHKNYSLKSNPYATITGSNNRPSTQFKIKQLV